MSASSKKSLILVKGKDRIHVRAVALTAESLNKSDVFVLDLGDKIYQWNGVHAHRNKRTKGVEVANRINTLQKQGKAKVIILEDEAGTTLSLRDDKRAFACRADLAFRRCTTEGVLGSSGRGTRKDS